jgi:hypothetical protein
MVWGRDLVVAHYYWLHRCTTRHASQWPTPQNLVGVLRCCTSEVLDRFMMKVASGCCMLLTLGTGKPAEPGLYEGHRGELLTVRTSFCRFYQLFAHFDSRNDGPQ